MDRLPLILDVDWFIIAGKAYPKKIAFYHLGQSQDFTFTLPDFARDHKSFLYSQSRHSHGLLWNTNGQFPHTKVHDAFDCMYGLLGLRPAQLEFYTKGLQKVRFFEEYVPEVTD